MSRRDGWEILETPRSALKLTVLWKANRFSSAQSHRTAASLSSGYEFVFAWQCRTDGDSSDSHLSLCLLTTIVPATMSYTVLLCWKKRSVINAGKKKAMEKFLFNALTVDLQKINKKLKVGKTTFVVTLFKNGKKWLQYWRRKCNICRWYHTDTVWLNQDRAVTCDHSQANKELPRCRPSSSPNTYDLKTIKTQLHSS